MANAHTESAAPTELNPLLYVFTQGSVRAFGTLATLGFAGVSCLKALVISLNIHNNTASVVLCNGLLMHLPCTNVRMSVCEIVIA